LVVLEFALIAALVASFDALVDLLKVWLNSRIAVVVVVCCMNFVDIVVDHTVVAVAVERDMVDVVVEVDQIAVPVAKQNTIRIVAEVCGDVEWVLVAMSVVVGIVETCQISVAVVGIVPVYVDTPVHSGIVTLLVVGMVALELGIEPVAIVDMFVGRCMAVHKKCIVSMLFGCNTCCLNEPQGIDSGCPIHSQ